MPVLRSPRSEVEVRVDLAAAYRLAALAGWADSIYTHLSAAVPGEPGVHLINPFGLGFDEIAASNLVKVNLRGDVVDGSGPDSETETDQGEPPCRPSASNCSKAAASR